MNKIVREHYPAAQLPKDLRPSDDPNVQVTVTVEIEERQSERTPSLAEIWENRKPPFRSKEEIDADLRQQRDEWND